MPRVGHNPRWPFQCVDVKEKHNLTIKRGREPSVSLKHLPSSLILQISAVATYGCLFQRVTALRLTHPALYTCHGNRAAALLRLGLCNEALLDAERCRLLAAESFKKCALLLMPSRQVAAVFPLHL